MKKITSIILASIMMCSVGTGCGAEVSGGSVSTSNSGSSSSLSGKVTASGSSALLPLAQKASGLFTDMYPDVIVDITGGGSGTGLTQVSDGSVDIGNSDVFAEEKLTPELAAELVDHQVCTTTMAAIVNTELGVDDLTKEELIGVFTAEITNWSEVGGPDLPIMLVTRPSSSGTRALFQQYAMDGIAESSASALETDDSGTLLETVQQNTGAIGYVSLAYLVGKDNFTPISIDGVVPSLENTYNGTYSVWGYEHMYTKGEGSEQAQKFIAYMMSEEFASNIEALGYGASSKLTQAAIDSHK